MPEWILKLARRLLGLAPGMYCIYLSIDEAKRPQWTVQPLGKVEQP